MYVILLVCSWYSNPPLWPWHNVCYSMFLKKYPAPLMPAKWMLFYIPDIVSRSFNPGSMYVILCSWHSLLPLRPRQNVCGSMILKKYPAPLTLAKCMLFYFPDMVSCSFDPGTAYVILCSWFFHRPCNTGTMYVILYSWYSGLPLQHRHNIRFSMSLIQ